MVKSCSGKTIKFLVFFFNFVVFVCGIAVVGGGATAMANKRAYDYIISYIPQEAATGRLDSALLLCICVGSFLLFVGFLGCCGAGYESSCLLVLFSAIMAVLVIIQFAGGCAALVFKDTIKRVVVVKGLEISAEGLATTNHTKKDIACRLWKDLQHSLKCCGIEEAFNETAIAGCPELLPCIAREGCADAVWSLLKNSAGIVAGVLIGLMMLEILAFMFACKLCKTMRKEKKGYNYA